ncbi:MAG: ATP-dependent helicase, partial [Actinophytocola sp.]|uniref:DEAD/DEAH box helicase n=1 Tax=Actinophytocola sp. TaxID=1872138 RepID=UPI001323C770
MLVLHGFWFPDDGLCLWAEDSERAVKSPSQALRSARPHPYAVPDGTLAGIHQGKPGEAVLQLPSLRSAPLDSPELIRVVPRPPARSAAALLSWTVPVVTLDAASALIALSERAEDIRHGASWDYLAELAAFARELVLRGRVLPTVQRDDVGAVAGWRPVLQGRDVVALHTLVTAMPPVCRAVPGHDDPHELVTGALRAFVDAAVRETLPTGIELTPVRRGRRPKRLPAVEAWLSALSAPDGRFDADADDLDELAGALRPWQDVGAGATAPARATFRLTEVREVSGEPGEDPEPRWQLEFLLQSMEDPSLLVPAERAWRDDGSLSRWLARPQELLLTELGKASRIYPDLANGLRQARPCAHELDADGAYHFLSTVAPALDEAGFGVLLPSWWDNRRKLGLTLSAYTPVDGVVAKKSRFGKNQLMDFQWQLAVGDDTLTDEEIAALADTKASLIRLRGQWVAVDPDQLKRGLAFLKRKPTGRKTAAEIIAMAASHPDDLDTPLPLTGVRADGWLGDLLGGTVAQSLRAVPTPDGFLAELRPYQQRGLSWLAFLSSLGLGACLADDMGLGKTIQLLAVESMHRAEHPDAGPTLLLCPMSLVGNWQREAAKFAPDLRVYAHHGRERLRGEALAERLDQTDLIVTTYATATRDIDELDDHEWHRVVLDEAQAIKNSLSQSAKAVRRLRGGHRIALTGTPVENRLAELWSIMDFLNPGMLGSAELFRTRYAIPVERHGLTEPAERLRAITRPYVLR